MKKILVVLFLAISIQTFALPTWNPWVRAWNFYVGEQELSFKFDDYGNAKDLNTGKTYSYDWDMTILYIFDYKGNDLLFTVEFDNGGSRFEGIEINSAVEVIGVIGS